MILDSHIHVGGWDYKYYSHLNVQLNDVEAILRDCDIDGALLLPTDRKNNQEVMEEIQNFRSNNTNGRRYWFFCWVDPNDHTMWNFLEKNLARIDGLKFHSGLDRVSGGIKEEVYRRFIEFALDNNLPVLAHCGRWQEMSSYKYGLEVAKRYPKLRLLLAHLGGDFEGFKIDSVRETKELGLKNVWFDISGTREFWTIEMGVKEMGAERFLFASDYPVMHPRMSISSIEVLDLSHHEKDLIYGLNLDRILTNEI